ncbi:hypothetical protein [Merismopedia glauca]|uniref:Uncharacterized protein n=1 Tax=Merismopedia glauca CCAP 1448/3 TaxID=1296344 RepID=A0A2T1C2K5_9CYAN|nr:hypothetical protein [Merismopedia glauca]PSB02353.1 hypothetical protein C7B64_13520 [Merismopedia glauca CCAP 1448/3]
MSQSIGKLWQTKFEKLLHQGNYGESLQQSQGLGNWTKAMTSAVVVTCQLMGWQASAKGYPLANKTVATSEFLALDVMAFASDYGQWQFPIAVMELENNPDRIDYSLWKVLCLRVPLRIVFCYCRSPSDRVHKIETLRNRIIQPMPVAERIAITGETLIVVGSMEHLDIFPHSFFKWWELNANTGNFQVF